MVMFDYPLPSPLERTLLLLYMMVHLGSDCGWRTFEGVA